MGAVQPLTTDPNSLASGGDWSPDGTRIVFHRCVAGRSGCQYDLFVMAADGTNQQNLTNTPNSNEEFPAFTPDGSKVGFMTDRDGNWEVYLMNADGTNPVNVTNNPARDVGPDFKS